MGLRKTFYTPLKVFNYSHKKKSTRALTDPEMVKKYFFRSSQVTDWKIGTRLFFNANGKGNLIKTTVWCKNIYLTKNLPILTLVIGVDCQMCEKITC